MPCAASHPYEWRVPFRRAWPRVRVSTRECPLHSISDSPHNPAHDFGGPHPVHRPRLAHATLIATITVAALGAYPLAPAFADAPAVAAVGPFFAGYADTGVGQDGATAGVFRVPDFACGADEEGIALEVYAISEDGEFLAGTDLFASCQDGTQHLDGHITTSGGQIPIWQELEPGDRIKLSITKIAQAPSTHTIAFENLDRGWVSSLPTNSPIDRIEIGFRRMSLDGVKIPPPAFTTKVKGVTFDDVRLDRADATRYRLVDDAGETLVKVSKPKRAKFRVVSVG